MSAAERIAELELELAELGARLARVREIHEPIEALNVRDNRPGRVCAGCGTDDGNWQVYPCPTMRALGEVAA